MNVSEKLNVTFARSPHCRPLEFNAHAIAVPPAAIKGSVPCIVTLLTVRRIKPVEVYGDRTR